MRESNIAILDAAGKAAPVLGDAILQASRADADEEFWTGLLEDADRQSGRTRQRDFANIRDQLDAIAFHSRHLERGENPLVQSWARELATLIDQASSPADMRPALAGRFTSTLELLLEALGSTLDGTAAAEVVAPAEAPEAAGASGTAPADEAAEPEELLGAAPHVTSVMELDGLEITVETVAAYNPRLAELQVSPIRAITIRNTADYSIAVEMLQIIGPSEAPEWSGPRLDVAAGDVIALTEAEVRWLPAPVKISDGQESPGATAQSDEPLVFELDVATMERARAREIEIPYIAAGEWSADTPPELLADLIPFDSPRVATIAQAAEAAVADLDDPTDADYAHAVAKDLAAELPDANSNGGNGTEYPQPAAASHINNTHLALTAAAVLERMGCPTVLVIAGNSLTTALGHPTTSVFDPASLTRGAFQADLSGLTPVGAAPKPDDVTYIVTVAELLERTNLAKPGTASPANKNAAATQTDTSRPPIVGRWLGELLQLDYRNPLLRMPKTTGAQIVVPPAQLAAFEDAFSSGERFDLHSLKKLDESQYQPEHGGTAFDAQLAAHDLFCEPLRDSFKRLLTRLQTQSEKAREESGKNTLHLTVGVLEWRDDKGETSASPLFVAPANLSGSADSGFALALEPGNAIEPNYTLHEKLKQMTGESIRPLIAPPTDDSGIDVDRALEQIAHELELAGIQHTILRTVRLLPLDFATQSLWSDLRDNWSTMLDKPVPDQLTRHFGTPFADPAGARALTPADEVTTTLVEPADGSQLGAIVAASAGKSFVLEGPPGTGKSQTITNMIADGLARGRKILFVAEKRAALDVVYGRLKAAGLGGAVLDLHDAKQSLRDARVQLREALAGLPKSSGTSAGSYSLSGSSGATGSVGSLGSGSLGASSLGSGSFGSGSEVATEADRGLAALHASVDLLRSYPEAVFGAAGAVPGAGAGTGSGTVPGSAGTGGAAGVGAATPAEESVWAAFRTCLEIESEFDITIGWQPDELDLPADLDDARARTLAALAKQLRRARKRADTRQDGASTAALLDLVNQLSAAGMPAVATAIRDGRSGDRLAEAIQLAHARDSLNRALADLPTAGTYSGRPTAVRRFIEQARDAIAANRSGSIGRLADTARGHAITPGFERFVRRNSPGSIRGLFQDYADQVLALTPCVLMSPLGVAKHLPAGTVEFDTVIFDEASQIRPANALSALGRARSAVIVGDRKQMPPPTEFSGRVEAEAVAGSGASGPSAGAGASGRLESLLTLAGKAGLEHRSLDWHYRSSNEALIAFSNRRYYDGQLITFPNPPTAGSGSAAGAGAAEVSTTSPSNLPIRYRFVGGVQESKPGLRAKVNEAERDAVVAEITRRLADDPERSIMVVTFNSAQQEYIAAELAESKDPDIVRALERREEPLAVKNVETVQGDERDVVLFSMTYAPDKATGARSNNFGPISRGGGELRFNVAITRARQEIVVFASLRSTDITISKSTRQGLRDMRAYLAIAEAGELPRVDRAPMGADLFRSRVAGQLRDRGFEVVEKVGESEFAVDLAVRRAGFSGATTSGWRAVMLDSPTWANRATVWDRDGLPVTILEGRMHWAGVARLLSAEWAADPEGAVDRLVQRLDGPVDVAGEAVEGGAETSAAIGAESERADGTGTVEATVASGAIPPAPTAAPEFGNKESEAAAGPEPEPTNVVEAEFHEASVRAVDGKDVLENVDRIPDARAWVKEQIADIVATEGPLPEDVLLRKVAYRFSHKKPRERVLRQIEELVTQRVTVDDDRRRFVWPDGVDPVGYNEYRTPGPGAPARNLSDISQRELGNAIVAVLQGEPHLYPDALLEQVVELFGGQRRNKYSRAALDQAVGVALRDHRIARDGLGRLTLVG